MYCYLGLHVYNYCLHWAPMSINSTCVWLFGALGVILVGKKDGHAPAQTSVVKRLRMSLLPEMCKRRMYTDVFAFCYQDHNNGFVLLRLAVGWAAVDV